MDASSNNVRPAGSMTQLNLQPPSPSGLGPKVLSLPCLDRHISDSQASRATPSPSSSSTATSPPETPPSLSLAVPSLPSLPSKAAAVLGAQEVFTSPSHAAYRRLVDFTHRPLPGGTLLPPAVDSTLPSSAHPSLTVRSARRSNRDWPSPELQGTSPEKKTGSGNKYKIMNMGIDDMKENVRERLNFLKKYSEPSPTVSSSSSSQTRSSLNHSSEASGTNHSRPYISPQQISRWSRSFEELLKDKYGLELFHNYLRSEYSEENIEFWIACEEFRQLSDSNPSSARKLVGRAQNIIRDFVCTQAPKEVNLDSKSRQATLEMAQQPRVGMFDTAQKRIQTLMEIDSYQRFLRSELLMSALQGGGGGSGASDSRRDLPAPTRTASAGSAGASTSTAGSGSAIVRISSVRCTSSGTGSTSNPSGQSGASSSGSMHPSSSDNCLPQSLARH